MGAWVPLFVALIWPLFLAGVLYVFREPIRGVAKTLAEKVGSAESVKVGPGGIELSGIQVPRALPVTADTRNLEGLPHPVYMTHWAARAPSLDRESLPYYRLKIAMDADKPEFLDQVERVVYHLDPTFREPDRESKDRTSSFAISTAAWGEFNMTAEVFRRGEGLPLVIERYINFLPPAT
jgi:hypothetical protein